MTDNDSPEQLDQILRQWSDRRATSPSHLERLKGQLVQALNEQPPDGLGVADIELPDSELPDNVAAKRQTRMRSVVWFAVGAAAMVLLLAGYSWLLRSSDVQLPLDDDSQLPPSYAWLQDEQLNNKAVLLDEMETVFDHQLTWLAETSERVELGVEKRTVSDRTTPVAVRVVVQRRATGQSEWTLVWAVDIVARSEERVLLKPRSAGEAQLEMWTYALPDGKIAVETDLMMTALSNVKVTTSALQDDRQPTVVYSSRSDGFEVRVFQTAAVLRDSVS